VGGEVPVEKKEIYVAAGAGAVGGEIAVNDAERGDLQLGHAGRLLRQI
jgi:hypothetical protein